MPNGFHGSREQWERIEFALRALDPTLEAFATEHDMSLSKNYHNWPERSLRWGAALNRLIQIYLADEDQLTWNVLLCASEDPTTGRYWKREFLRVGVPIDDVRVGLDSLLTEAVKVLEGWLPEDLEFATKLK